LKSSLISHLRYLPLAKKKICHKSARGYRCIDFFWIQISSVIHKGKERPLCLRGLKSCNPAKQLCQLLAWENGLRRIKERPEG
jgi:hypothetical protein